MARAPKAGKAVVPAAYSPPATRTRSRTANTQPSASRSNDAAAHASSASVSAAPKKRAGRQPRADRTEPTSNRVKKTTTRRQTTTKKTNNTSTRRAAAAATNHTATNSEKRDDTAPATTPARAPGRRTRAALKAGTASPLTPASDFNSLTKKKDITPLDVMIPDDSNAATEVDPDDWFPNLPRGSIESFSRGPKLWEEVMVHVHLGEPRGTTLSWLSTRLSNEVRGAVIDLAQQLQLLTAELEQAKRTSLPIESRHDNDHTQDVAPAEAHEAAEPASADDENEAASTTEEAGEEDNVPEGSGDITKNQDMDMETEDDADLDASDAETEQDIHAEERDNSTDGEDFDDMNTLTSTPEVTPSPPRTPRNALESQESEQEPPTTSRRFGFGIISSVTSAVTKLFATPRRSPIRSTEQSPVASPAKAAHDRKTRQRDTPSKPRMTDADKRHAMHEAVKSKIEMEQQMEKEIAEQEAQYEPGQKRRRMSPETIPAHRPGERGYGMVEEYFDLDSSDLTSINKSSQASPRTPESAKPPAKRRRTESSAHSDDDDEESSTPQPPTTLKRPRNGFRRYMMLQGHEDPMVTYKQEKRALHTNSFREPQQEDPHDDLSQPDRLSTPPKPSPSTVYTGSVAAMPGDVGFKSPNVFKQSQQQVGSKKSRSKTDLDALKHAAEAVAKKDEKDRTEEEKRILEEGQRKLGHIAGTGSFSAPEYSSDEDDSSTFDDSDSDELADTGFSRSPSKAPVQEPQGIARPVSDQAAFSTPSKKVTFADPSNAFQKPPPPPVPAHAELPRTTPNNVNTPTKPSAPASTHPTTPATLDPKSTFRPTTTPATTGPKTMESASLARARELAEKHKPKTASRLQFSQRASSSPVHPHSPEEKESIGKIGTLQAKEPNNMSLNLITQSLTPPLNGPLLALTPSIDLPISESDLNAVPSWFSILWTDFNDPDVQRDVRHEQKQELVKIQTDWDNFINDCEHSIYDTFGLDEDARKKLQAQVDALRTANTPTERARELQEWVDKFNELTDTSEGETSAFESVEE